jgi:hypothetical protein
MFFTPFCACLLLLLFTLLFDLRARRLLRNSTQTKATQSFLAYWPLQVFIHLSILYLVASTPVIHKRIAREAGLSFPFRVGPGPIVPSFPPVATDWKKHRVERL